MRKSQNRINKGRKLFPSFISSSALSFAEFTNNLLPTNPDFGLDCFLFRSLPFVV